MLDPRIPTNPRVAANYGDDYTEAQLIVPSYNGPVTFTLRVELTADGDYRVFIPWFRDDEYGNPAADRGLELESGHEVLNGIVYIGSPDH